MGPLLSSSPEARACSRAEDEAILYLPGNQVKRQGPPVLHWYEGGLAGDIHPENAICHATTHSRSHTHSLARSYPHMEDAPIHPSGRCTRGAVVECMNQEGRWGLVRFSVAARPGRAHKDKVAYYWYSSQCPGRGRAKSSSKQRGFLLRSRHGGGWKSTSTSFYMPLILLVAGAVPALGILKYPSGTHTHEVPLPHDPRLPPAHE